MLRKHIDKSVMLSFGIASAIGGLLGALAHSYCQDPVLQYLFAGLLIFAGFLALTGLSKRFVLPKGFATIAGILSGAFGGMVGNQGGIRAATLLNFQMSKESFVATATAIGVIVDLARMPVYITVQGTQLWQNLPILLSMSCACILGTYIGKQVLGKIPEAVFSRIVGAIILSLGVYMAVKH